MLSAKERVMSSLPLFHDAGASLTLTILKEKSTASCFFILDMFTFFYMTNYKTFYFRSGRDCSHTLSAVLYAGVVFR